MKYKGNESTSNRRFTMEHNHDPATINEPRLDHPMLVQGRTRYRKTRCHPHDSPRLLVGGHNNSKIGKTVKKGEWSGMRIFTLTLEERATCSRSCFMWRGCYGNSMHMSRRHEHGAALENRLAEEIAMKAKEHPRGFVVRLHILGDFYSLEYIMKWHQWLNECPQLHVFGYTHRHPWAEDPVDADMGHAIAGIKDAHPSRFRIRWSSENSVPDGATVIRRRHESAIVSEGQICATYLSKDASCSTCGMCWAETLKDQTIVFEMHGPKVYGRKHVVKRSARNNLKFGRLNHDAK